MSDRFFSMRQLRDHIEDLLKECDLEMRTVRIDPAPRVWQWVERLVQDKALCNYLEGLDTQVEQVIKVVKDYKLNVWGSQQNEKLLDEQEQQLEEQKQLLKQQKQKLEEQKQQLEGHRQKLTVAEAEKQRLSAACKEAEAAVSGLRKEQKEYILDMISMRDNLLAREDWLRDYAPGDSNTAKVIAAQLKETAGLLERIGVKILDETGAFDKQRHTVVETRPAQAPEQIDQIAETFRPGYAFQDETIRPQEVILYVKPQEES